MPRERYVVRDGKLVQVGTSYVPRTRSAQGLQIIKDIEPYQSPVDDKYVGGRAQRRDDLKRTNCREYEPTEKKYAERARQESEARVIDRMGQTMARIIPD